MTGSHPESTQSPAVLEIRGLTVEYGSGASALRALSGVDLDLARGQVLGIVGESGSGKSTLAAAVTRLLRPPGRTVGGSVTYRSRQGRSVEVLTMSDPELRTWRWDEVAVVFQAAMNSLNPVATIAAQLTDTLEVHRPQLSKSARLARAQEVLDLVRIPHSRLRSYPHELSGGMRQRVMIAMALALDPEIIIMDEPTTALDVVVQSDILDRMVELQDQLGFSVIFITHDLSLLLEIADAIAVMYAGRIVEFASASALLEQPLHPYTAGLLASFPSLSGPRRELVGIPGVPADIRGIPPGCAFHPRCAEAMDMCRHIEPAITRIAERTVACHLRSELHRQTANAGSLEDATGSVPPPAPLSQHEVSGG